MANSYFLGVLFALLGGIANNGGAVLQKYAINQIPKENRDDEFYKSLVKNPYWLLGIVLIIAASGILFMLAQAYIGAALVPGLAAIGLVVLALGAIKILHEKIQKTEIMGIIIMMVGILFIGLSSLEIIDVDMVNLSDSAFLMRIMVYTALIFSLWMIFRQAGKRSKKGKTLLLSLAAGVPFALSNAWLQPFLFLAATMFSEGLEPLEIGLFIFSIVVVAGVNIVGLIHIQDAFKEGDASKVAPISQIPQQITPVIIYFAVYMKATPNPASIWYIFFGVTLVCIAGFLLGKRQGQLEVIE